MRRPIARWVESPLTFAPTIMSDMLRSMANLLGETGHEVAPAATWGPRVDVINADQEVVVKADVPGVKKEDLKVEVVEGQLLISGELKQESEVKDESYHRVERRWGRFARAIELPAPVQEDAVTAKLQDGVLEVHAPKATLPPAGRAIAVE